MVFYCFFVLWLYMFGQPVNAKADIAHACSPSGRFSHVE